MPSFWDEIGEFGSDILEAGGDIVGGFGQNYANQADYQSALIQRIAVNNQLALRKYQDEARRKDDLQKFLKNIIFVAILIAVALIVINQVKK